MPVAVGRRAATCLSNADHLRICGKVGALKEENV